MSKTPSKQQKLIMHVVDTSCSVEPFLRSQSTALPFENTCLSPAKTMPNQNAVHPPFTKIGAVVSMIKMSSYVQSTQSLMDD